MLKDNDLFEVDLDLPIYDENNDLIFENGQYTEQLLIEINRSLELDSLDLNRLKEMVKNHNESRIMFTQGILIKLFVLRVDKSTDIQSIELIDKINSNFILNQSTITYLTKSQINLLREKIIKSDMITLFKTQILNKLDGVLYKGVE